MMLSKFLGLMALVSSSELPDDECSDNGDGSCALNALQLRGMSMSSDLSNSSEEGSKCAPLSDPSNSVCAPVVRWASRGGQYDPHANDWFEDMRDISGVDFHHASLGDWQKLYFCAPPGGKQCGTPPCQCSNPPCDVCYNGNGGGASATKGCGADPDSISCKPPKKALDYNGKAWDPMSVPGYGPFHVFAIGDWGGMDGTLRTIEGRPELIAYPQGVKSGPSVFPRTRWNKAHTKELCDHKQFVACYTTMGRLCDPGCGFVKGIDDQPQILVAKSLKMRAAKMDPAFILNVGDNFYWGGIEKTCGTPMNELSYTAHHQFNQIFEGVYNGKGLDGKVWLSVLGNHDWGGRVFNNGWDQQIAYTWKSNRWRLPAAYWSQHVDFPDAGFSMDIFMVDSNAMDAKDLDKDSEHNICGEEHNPPGATCASAGGPTDLGSCKQWFWDLWAANKAWLAEGLSKSKADWQVAVTHFPCGHESGFYVSMHQQYGLDLLVTGHRHDQEQLTKEGYYSVYGKAGARTEMPGCSLCMGNQARVADNATVVSTSTRNFPNRLGKGANVFLASAELASVAAILGRLPTPDEYLKYHSELAKNEDSIYQYLNFDQVEEYVEKANSVNMSELA